jgi:hypothetical protein
MNRIILKKSSVEGKVPLAGDLEYGELAINYKDGKLFYKTADNQIITLLSAAPNVDGGSAATEFDPATRIDGGAA